MDEKKLIDVIQRELSLTEKYLFEHQGSDHLWRDFYSRTHKESVDWATAYIGDFLLESGVDQHKLENTAARLASRQNPDGGWGYSEIAFSSDTDTTANSILVLSHFDNYTEQLMHAKRYLLKHQRASAGFATFNQDEVRKYQRVASLPSVDGWCMEIPDVTARVIQALQKFPDMADHVSCAMDYLAGEQRSDGGWNCYWWNNDVYSTALCSQLFDSPIAERGKNWLQRHISGVPFYDALSLLALTDKFDARYTDPVSTLLNTLIATQREDGCWSSQHILRVPHPSNESPWLNNESWRTELDDQNRLFATVTAYAALKKYVNKILKK